MVADGKIRYVIRQTMSSGNRHGRNPATGHARQEVAPP
jgi:hypothetical protein